MADHRGKSVGPDKLEVLASFCCLGDMLSAAGGCDLKTTTCVKIAWKKFKELLPILSSHHLSFKICGRMYSSCVWSAMLHVGETWPLTKPDLHRLNRNDRAMISRAAIAGGIAESGNSWLSTCMIDIPGDLVRDLPWLQEHFIQNQFGLNFAFYAVTHSDLGLHCLPMPFC